MNNSTILVVDDDPTLLKFVGANLRAQGSEVITAENGESALKAFEEESLDLVILDIMMPDMTGEEVCHRIRKQSSIPIIILTANDNLNDKVQLLNQGANDYITKPFVMQELLARVQARLRRNRGGIAKPQPQP